MFTGIIEQQGTVLGNQCMGAGNRLIIQADFSDLQTGESIAVNGVCLTLLPMEKPGVLQFDISPETLHLTSLGLLKAENRVNLERAMQASARFGGHYVSGHVDKTARLKSQVLAGDFIELTVAGFEPLDSRFLLPKGSITIEGVSLTINAVEKDSISLMLIPHTLAKTTLGSLISGQSLNIEFDYLTRIVAHQLPFAQALFEVTA